MHTADRRAYRQALPNWGHETERVMADTHRLMADIARGLRYAAHLQGLDQISNVVCYRALQRLPDVC